MGVAGFAISLVLLVLASTLVARRLSRTSAERFWIGVAAGAIQVGAATTALSLVRAVTPGAMLVMQAVITLATWIACRGGGPVARTQAGMPVPPKRGTRRRWSALDRVLLSAIVVMTLLTAFEQCFLAVSNIDDRNYRASRAAYWLEHRSLFGWDSHNDRQVAFPPGGSMPFFVGVLFTRNETAGLLLQWAAYPMVAAGAYLLLRSLRQTPTVSLLGTVALCFTPIVLLHTRGVQPELWLTLCTLGCAYWAVRALRRRRGTFAAAMAGIFAALAIDVRMTALPLLFFAFGMTLIKPHQSWRRAVAMIAGAVLGVVLSGLLPVLVYNVRTFGHPLGSAMFQEIHTAPNGVEQWRAHSARSIVVLLEPPFVPDALRDRATAFSKWLLRVHFGDVTLPREDRPWPGRFTPESRRWAENFSLGGLVVVGLSPFAVWRWWRRMHRRRRWRSPDVIALLGFMFLTAVMLVVRWMGGMGRFWIAPYALIIVAATAYLAPVARRRRWVGVACIVFVALLVVPAAFHRATLVGEIARPESTVALDEPYAEVLARVPARSTILLAAGQGTRDYPLFSPREGFANRVMSWGRHAFDAERLRRMMADERVTYVVVENDVALDFDWDPPMATGAMVAALANDPAFAEVPLEYTPHMRLFARKSP